jgi:hypothetical protein
MDRSINSRELILWFRSKEEFDTTKYFWCNKNMSDKLGLDRDEDGLVFTMDYYEALVTDEEGQGFIDRLKEASAKIREIDHTGFETYNVKVRNKKSGKLVYLHYILEVFERYPNGDIKTWGGNGIDVTDLYVQDSQPYVIEGIGCLNYNMITNKIYRNGKEKELNPIESRIFLLLVEANGGIVSYEKLKDYMDYPDVATVMEIAKVYIHRLRSKIKQIECKSVSIVSHYAKGYSLRIDE